MFNSIYWCHKTIIAFSEIFPVKEQKLFLIFGLQWHIDYKRVKWALYDRKVADCDFEMQGEITKIIQGEITEGNTNSPENSQQTKIPIPI